ncbi:hypothetical protein Tmel_1116 [Thermosipho melanesiensis BI429]|uniref:Uncharacterized protein n=2 Tax=Thermosipho melanesiensis TaxID=46541 RepID=A6LM20_THEM4|nr:hypothetical protein Tmel_1116 [Thermosipho melanesiensis BI429]
MGKLQRKKGRVVMNDILKSAFVLFFDKNLKFMCESTDFTELKSYYGVDLPEYNVYLPIQLGEHRIIKINEKFVCDPFTKLKQKEERNIWDSIVVGKKYGLKVLKS